MTHAFPTFVLQPIESVQRRYPTMLLDWPARLGFLLTFLKIPATLLMVWLLYVGQLQAVSVLVVWSMFMDWADGVIFNRSAHATDQYLRESRRIWDGTLDRFMIWTTLLFAVLMIGFPLQIFAVIMLREFIVCLVTGLPYVKTGFVHAPNWPSKLGAVMIGVQVILYNATSVVPTSSFIAFLLLSTIGIALYITSPRRI